MPFALCIELYGARPQEQAPCRPLSRDEHPVLLQACNGSRVSAQPLYTVGETTIEIRVSGEMPAQDSTTSTSWFWALAMSSIGVARPEGSAKVSVLVVIPAAPTGRRLPSRDSK